MDCTIYSENGDTIEIVASREEGLAQEVYDAIAIEMEVLAMEESAIAELFS